MFYQKAITIATGYTSSRKKINYLKVSNGVITKVFVAFPPGCAGLVHVQLFEGGHQFIPSTEGQSLVGDNYTWPIDEWYPIKQAPRWITIKTWNEDDTYAHTVQIAIDILPKEVVAIVSPVEYLMTSLKSLVMRGGEKKK